MLSRVANAIYWMARYVERAENIARLIDVNLHLLLDVEQAQKNPWEPLVMITGDEEEFHSRYDRIDAETALEFLTFDTNYANSIVTCAGSARENARSIRETISSELWEAVNNLYHFVRTPATRDQAREAPHEFYSALKTHSQLFVGLSESTMSHGEAWHFLSLGRMLERADKTSRMLDVKYFILLPDVAYVGSTYDNIQWAAVLESASALEMYRKRFHRIAPGDVVRFLLFDGYFPRSVRYCSAQAQEHLHAITCTPVGSYSNAAEQWLGRLCAELDYSDLEEVFRTGIHQYIDVLQAQLNETGDAIFRAFFSMELASHSIQEQA